VGVQEDKALEILLGAVEDAIRQEARHLAIMRLCGILPNASLTKFREYQLAFVIGSQLRQIGCDVELEAYFYDEDRSRRPDLAIMIPSIERRLFLEIKPIGPYYGYPAAVNDIKKLNGMKKDPRNEWNGLIALGFRDPAGEKERFEAKYGRMSKEITTNYPYREIGIRRVKLSDMDSSIPYALVGLWVKNDVSSIKRDSACPS
jgi:hypothetical protein